MLGILDSLCLEFEWSVEDIEEMKQILGSSSIKQEIGSGKKKLEGKFL